MNLTIHGNHLEVSPALREHVASKLGRIERHFDQVIDATVQLTVEKLRQRAEITLRVRGNNIHVESLEDDMYAAIDTLVDKLDRQVIRHKDRVKDHHGNALKPQQAASNRSRNSETYGEDGRPFAIFRRVLRGVISAPFWRRGGPGWSLGAPGGLESRS